MFVCEFCGYATQRHNDHKKHVESIHKGVQFNCELCSAMFRWGRSLRRHVKDKHENGRKGELKKKLKKEEREDDGYDGDGEEEYDTSTHNGYQHNFELSSPMFRWRDSLRRYMRNKHENGRKGELNVNVKKVEKKDDGEVLTESFEKRLLWEYEEKKRKIELGGRILNIAYENNINVGLLEGVDKEALNMYLEYSCM